MNKAPLFLRVVATECASDYILRLMFSTGEIRLADITSFMQKGFCSIFQDFEYIKSFRLDPFTADWNNEIGFVPRHLHERDIAA